MNVVWTSQSTSNFRRASHRSRYLTCDGLTTPPVDNAPLYAMQYIAHSRYPVFATPRDTHIVFATSSTLHLVRTSQWKDVVGLQSAANGKFNTVPFLWTNPAAGSPKKAYETETRSKMTQFELQSVEALYDEIVARCRFGAMPSTFTAYELRQTLVRPPSPATGIALGTPLEFGRDDQLTTVDSSNPPSRRRNYLRRGRAGRELGSGRRTERFPEETEQDETEVT